MTEDPQDQPDATAYYWTILALSGVGLVLIVLNAVARHGDLGSGTVARLLRADAVSMFGILLWTASILLAMLVALLQGRWGWVVALLMVPLSQIAFAFFPLHDAYDDRRNPLDYTSPAARAEAEAEHAGRRT